MTKRKQGPGAILRAFKALTDKLRAEGKMNRTMEKHAKRAKALLNANIGERPGAEREAAMKIVEQEMIAFENARRPRIVK